MFRGHRQRSGQAWMCARVTKGIRCLGLENQPELRTPFVRSSAWVSRPRSVSSSARFGVEREADARVVIPVIIQRDAKLADEVQLITDAVLDARHQVPRRVTEIG